MLEHPLAPEQRWAIDAHMAFDEGADFCVACEHLVAGGRFCSRCGHELRPAPAPRQQCRNCDTQMAGSASYCPTCGTAVETPEQLAEQAAAALDAYLGPVDG